jgi:predicted metal-binding membrane protein
MTDAAINAVLRRDRAVVLAAIVVMAGLAWAYIVWLAGDMDMGAGTGSMGASMGGSMGSSMGSSMGASMDHGMGASMGTMLAPAFRPWSAADFTFTFVMWSVMMVGMMLPSVTPMLLLYAAAGRKAAATGTPLAATGWFVAGYLLVWLVFSFVATMAQWQLGRFALITPMLSRASDLFGGVVLIVAGLYQWSPLKDACLASCQSPFGFLISRGGFSASPSGSLRLGAEHGALCVGCCWVLMALLFVGGVMNLLWIAALTIFILLEKIVPTGRLIPRLAGAAMLAAGLFLLYRSF